MERPQETPVEFILSDESIARIRRLMASQGIVDALEDDIPSTTEHPEDNKWL